ncbi:MAG TPA: sigma-70 family RNA polymerase sigma factor [Acidimicrobiales bacterium]|nr:sigma-70 family RNA polymerase sigma factor [Acidimicrobiales bacterium]
MTPTSHLDLTSAAEDAVVERTIPRALSTESASPPPACDADTWLLHVRFQRTGSPEALEALVEEYRAMALSLARRMHRGAEPLDDLQQVALEALVRCLRGFDCNQSTPFVGYATPAILGALKRHYRDHGWSLRVPRRAHELAAPARDADERLTAQLGRRPTTAETAAALGVDARELEAAEAARRARGLVRLDAPVHVEDGEGPGRDVPVLEAGFDEAESHLALSRALQHLDERERTVLGLYFFEDLTQSEIAQRFGVSQMQVSRWIRSSLARLRSRMEAEDGTPLACAS